MLEDLLAGLREGGTVDSPGAFTLSREEALQKIGRRPFGSLPWLINAALASGATYLRFVRLSRELLLEHDGAPPTSLNAVDSDDLTMGLLVAAREGVTWQGGGLRLSAGPGRWEVRAGTPQPHQQLRLACPPHHDGLFYWLDRLKLAPVRVEFEGQHWNEPGPKPSFMVSRTTEHARFYLGRNMFAHTNPGLPTLVLVLGGISVKREPEWPEAHVVVYPPGLRRTVEGDDVVENDAYRELLADLYATLQDVARDALAQIETLGPAVKRSLGWGMSAYLTSES